ncbi:MAG: iron chelate uptake ABC transporter family permease subunit, partial [Ilumatobacteraceae bacterium]
WTQTRLLLTGVIVAAGCGAMVALLLSIAPESQLRGMLFWLMGDLSQVDSLVSYIDTLISAWSKGQTEGAVLQHGQAEHALEAHLLSGRLALTAPQGPLRLAVPFRSGTLGAAQFPTLWGDVTAPARYLDALLADDEGRPWAVELKDQDAGGGQGAYLRHGVGQAVLYRHYIRSASALEPWFDRHGLHPEDCQAALAFPTASAGAAATIERLRQLAEVFDVNVIEFARPG